MDMWSKYISKIRPVEVDWCLARCVEKRFVNGNQTEGERAAGALLLK